jgi:hypothetical protein
MSSRTEAIGEDSREQDNNMTQKQGVLERMKRIRSAPPKIIADDTRDDNDEHIQFNYTYSLDPIDKHGPGSADELTDQNIIYEATVSLPRIISNRTTSSSSMALGWHGSANIVLACY